VHPHRPGPPPHLPEGPLERVGRPDLPLVLVREVQVAEVLVEVAATGR